MLETKRPVIRTPWSKVNDLFAGGIPAQGLWIMPDIDRDVMAAFFANVLAAQPKLMNLEELHPVRDGFRFGMGYMDCYSGANDVDTAVAKLMAKNNDDEIGPSYAEHVDYSLPKFREKGLEYTGWKIHDYNSIDETLEGIGTGLLEHNIEARVFIVDRAGFDGLSDPSLRVALRDLRSWSIANHVLVIVNLPLTRALSRFDSNAKPLVDRFAPDDFYSLYQHKGIANEADGEFLVAHNHETNELVIRYGKFRAHPLNNRFGEVRFKSPHGEFPEWDVK